MFCIWQNSVEFSSPWIDYFWLRWWETLDWYFYPFPVIIFILITVVSWLVTSKLIYHSLQKPFRTKNWDEFSSLQSYKCLFCHGCILKVGSNDSCHYSFDLWARNVKRACYHPNKKFLCLNQSYFINLVRM